MHHNRKASNRVFILLIICLVISILLYRSCNNKTDVDVKDAVEEQPKITETAETESKKIKEKIEDFAENQPYKETGEEKEFKKQPVEDVYEYWSGEWIGSDKWKRKKDIIRLEVQGSSYVVLEEMTEPRIFKYDEEKNLFVWEADFYGKPLKHVIKFLTKDSIIRTSWSGEKAFPELYQRVKRE